MTKETLAKAYSGAIDSRSRVLRTAYTSYLDLCATASKTPPDDAVLNVQKQPFRAAATKCEGEVVNNSATSGLTKQKVAKSIRKEFTESCQILDKIKKPLELLHPAVLAWLGGVPSEIVAAEAVVASSSGGGGGPAAGHVVAAGADKTSSDNKKSQPRKKKL